MRLLLVCVGRLKAGPERDLVARYKERAEASGRSLGLKGPDIVEIDESRSRRADDRKAEEAAAIRAALVGRLIVFDEKGRALDSAGFATRIGGWRDSGEAAATLVIGGPDGLSSDLVGAADLHLAFGAMTLPHQLVRVMACEQIYRMTTILSGHPYHRV